MHPKPIPMREAAKARTHPLHHLSLNDLDFIVQFVLASGSLKQMAELYGVSYPTMRTTLDRLIERLRQSTKGEPPDAVTELLAQLVERGEIEPGTARSIRAVYRDTLERKLEAKLEYGYDAAGGLKEAL